MHILRGISVIVIGIVLYALLWPVLSELYRHPEKGGMPWFILITGLVIVLILLGLREACHRRRQ